MTVAELIEWLQKQPPEAKVFCWSSFRPWGPGYSEVDEQDLDYCMNEVTIG